MKIVDIKQLIGKHRARVAIYGFSMLVACFAVMVSLRAGTNQPIASSGHEKNASADASTSGSSTVEAEKEAKSPSVARKIDGSMVSSGDEDIFPYAVMIENHIDSRPPSGLSKANIVYAADAEGGITRFLAVYAANEKIERIGPIRSARPYFIDWAEEYGSLYVHCGGSPDALKKIKAENVFDFNEFYNGSYFWRDRARKAPHNVYTSSGNIIKYLILKGKEKKNYAGWSYKDKEGSLTGASSTPLAVKRKPGYRTEWKYDPEKNDYLRYMENVPHKDADGSEIRAKNVIIQHIKTWITDDYGRRTMKTVGQGKAEICEDGRCIDGFWKKTSRKTRTISYGEDDKEVKFNRGTTWIEVVSAYMD